MSAPGNTQLLQQDVQNELTTANQLLRLISIELHKIKEITNPGGELETNIKENTALTAALAKIQRINISNLPPLKHMELDMMQETTENMSNQHDSFRRMD